MSTMEHDTLTKGLMERVGISMRRGINQPIYIDINCALDFNLISLIFFFQN